MRGAPCRCLAVCASLLVLTASPVSLGQSRPPGAASAQPSSPWALVEDEEGIQIWRQARPGPGLPAFRGRGEMKASVWRLLAILEDTARGCEWIPDCGALETVEQLGPHTYVIYHRTIAPWPVRDRDVLTHVSVQHFARLQEVHVNIRSIVRKTVPELEDAVRMPSVRGRYRFRQIAPRRSMVEYEVRVDPGGYLPRWVREWVVSALPRDTISNLRARARWAVARDAYRAEAAALREEGRVAGFPF